MRDSASVISQAVKGIDADDLAADMDVSVPRLYEILSKDCPYPRTKELIRSIGRHSEMGARLIRADLDAMFSDLLCNSLEEANEVQLHKEAYEAVQACLENKSRAERLKELRELVSVAEMMIEGIERTARAGRVVSAKFARGRG